MVENPVFPWNSLARRCVEWLKRHGLRVLAVGKIGKAALLTAVGFGSLRLINRDVSELARHWALVLRVDPENHVARLLLERLSAVNPVKLRHFGHWSLFFAADQVVEGIGLWFNQAWAKYLMLVATGVFLLDRCYLLGRRFTWNQIPLFVGTALLFLFILWLVKQDRTRNGGSRHPSPSHP